MKAIYEKARERYLTKLAITHNNMIRYSVDGRERTFKHFQRQFIELKTKIEVVNHKLSH